MRICSYNIHGGCDAQRNDSLTEIGVVLQTVGADVILLQEVDRFLPRSKRRDQAAILAATLGTNFHFYGRLRFLWTAFGNAILLKNEKVASAERLRLPSRGGEPRAALGVRLTDGTTIWNTHLGLHEKWRETQLDALARAVERAPGPAIVGGDFNAFLDSPEVRAFLERTGLAPMSADAPTFPASAPTARIDFLLGRGVKALAAGVVGSGASDHCLIWVDV